MKRIKKISIIMTAIMTAAVTLTACQSNAQSGIKEDTLFARNFIRVQQDMASAGLGAFGDEANRYTVEDLSSVTRLDTYRFDESKNSGLYGEDGIKQVDKAFFTNKDYPDYEYFYGEKVLYNIKNNTYNIVYGGELSFPDISLTVKDNGSLYMRIQPFNTENNSVAEINGIYPSDTLYELALEHRKNRDTSLYVTDEQLEKIKSEFAQYIKNHSSVFGEGYTESSFETYELNEENAYYPTIRYTAKTKTPTTAEEQILDYNDMFCTTVTICYNGCDTFISMDGIAPNLTKTGAVDILPYEEAKKKMTANEGVYAIQPFITEKGEDKAYCPTNNELLKEEYTTESDMTLTYALTKAGYIIPVYVENRTYKQADSATDSHYYAVMPAAR